MSDQESIEYTLEKSIFSKAIRRSIQLRLSIVQLITIFLIIYLITLPILNFLNRLFSFSSVTNPEGGFVNASIIFTFFMSLILIIFILKSKPYISPYFFIFIVIIIILDEVNPFWLSFKFCAALFYYELPFIIRYYSEIFKGYQSYSSQQITELSHLRILFDKHLSFLLSMTAIMIGSSWLLIILSDRIIINLGQEAGVTIPLVIIIFLAFVAYFRSDISESIFYFQTTKKESSFEGKERKK